MIIGILGFIFGSIFLVFKIIYWVGCIVFILKMQGTHESHEEYRRRRD